MVKASRVWFGWLLCVAIATPAAAAERARNVVLMVADGAGFNSWKAAAMYEGSSGKQFFDDEGWVRSALSTHLLRRQQMPLVSEEHALRQLAGLAYDPARAWDTTPTSGDAGEYPYYFEGYRWLRQTAPDSAATMTTMVSGIKTYRGSINHDGAGEPVTETVAELAHRAGKKVGVVSSVPFNHATPAAAAGAHRPLRHEYCALAVDMLTSPYPDVIAGCGNPDFDNNGRPITDESRKLYTFIGGKELWEQLTGKTPLPDDHALCKEGEGEGIVLDADQRKRLDSWSLVQAKHRIEALHDGTTPDRLLILPEVGDTGLTDGRVFDPDRPFPVRMGGTLQQQRGSKADPEYTEPGHDPLTESIPSLESLTRAALNALDDDEQGFFLHVEGGAVDWAMHQNQLGRMIEELQDFERTVRTVADWIEKNGGWNETLLIVTSDHDHMLWGPNADTRPFDPLVDNGAGKLPSYRWLSNGHSNALVPLFARGVGAARFEALATGEDPFYGRYADQADVYRVIRSAIVD
jgi:alkaline phosphatase